LNRIITKKKYISWYTYFELFEC